MAENQKRLQRETIEARWRSKIVKKLRWELNIRKRRLWMSCLLKYEDFKINEIKQEQVM